MSRAIFPGLMRSRLYKSRLLWVAGVLLIALAARGEVVGGAQLPSGAQRVGADRYRAPEDFDSTLKYYRSVYPSERYPRKPIINQPGVKAVHIENPSGKNFEGLNIYEANEGEVRIFIVRASK